MDQTKPKNIDEYIAGFPEDVQEILQKIRMTIRKAAPSAEEAIKYQLPTFTLNGNLEEQRHLFFSKGQPCFRASPLTKRYGWGIHSNKEGKIALVGVESEAYQSFVLDKSVIKTKAMRSKRA